MTGRPARIVLVVAGALAVAALVALGVRGAADDAAARPSASAGTPATRPPSPSATRTPSPPPHPTAPPPSYPSAATTGVPRGTVLTPSGSLDVTTPGAVLVGLDIDGCVDVHASHVTIRNSRITCSRPTTAVRQFDGFTGLTLEDVEINGTGVVSAAVGFSDYTLTRVNIHDVVDGPRLSSNTTLVDSFVHNLVRTPDSHNDAVQVTGGDHIVIRHNTLDAYDPASGDLFNSAIMVGSTTAPVNDLLIEANYLNGGNYTVNFRADLVGSGIVGRDNIFGPDHRYGELAHADVAGVDWSGDPASQG